MKRKIFPYFRHAKEIHLKKLIIILLVFSAFNLGAQSQKIGVRAGLNQSWFSGPLETNESMTRNGGFHFGLNYSYYFNDFFGLRFELLYNQRGTTHKYDGETYYILRRGNERLVDYGDTDYILAISNGYLSLPVSASLYVLPKLEIFGGLGLDFLLSPTGRGRNTYTSTDFPDGIRFTQSMDYNFFSDEAGAANLFNNSTIALLVEGEALPIPRVIGAYYFFEDKDGNRFKPVDLSLHAGVNYFLNTGFFVGATLNYGLSDITRNQMDVSIGELNPDGSFILREDSDHQLSLQVSLGFRF